MEKEKWINTYACRFCRGSRLHSCTGYDCRAAAGRAEAYYDRTEGEQMENRKVYISGPVTGTEDYMQQERRQQDVYENAGI